MMIDKKNHLATQNLNQLKGEDFIGMKKKND